MCVHRIGITGHRHLSIEIISSLTAEIQKFFREESTRYGAENISVLSSLAEGADTLCAKLAMDTGFRLVVPLPLDASEYRKDFLQAAEAEFDHMFSQADEVFVAPPEEVVSPNAPRGFYYRQASIYVVKHCDIMLTVWDGVECNTTDGAGTWETIKLARAFGKPVHCVSASRMYCFET